MRIKKNFMKADKKSWRILPITDNKVPLDIFAEYSEEEFQKISNGFIPHIMEEKWFIYMEDNTLWFHRSWTGLCIFQVKFRKERDKYVITEAWVDSVKDVEDSNKMKYWSGMVLFLINVILLGKKEPMPELEDDDNDPAKSFINRFHLCGYQGVSEKEVTETVKIIKKAKKNKRSILYTLMISFQFLYVFHRKSLFNIPDRFL